MIKEPNTSVKKLNIKKPIKKSDPVFREKFGAISYVITNITRHRWRTILTVIGVAVPIAFFILFAALGYGLDQFILSRAEEINIESYCEMSKIVNAWTEVLMCRCHFFCRYR